RGDLAFAQQRALLVIEITDGRLDDDGLGRIERDGEDRADRAEPVGWTAFKSGDHILGRGGDGKKDRKNGNENGLIPCQARRLSPEFPLIQRESPDFSSGLRRPWRGMPPKSCQAMKVRVPSRTPEERRPRSVTAECVPGESEPGAQLC